MSDKTHERSYAQFADPVGLAKRLLFSGDKDAWWGLGQAPFKVLSGAIDATLSKLVSDEVPPENRQESFPQIFLIGGPRSGTTLCHLALAYTFNVTYFSNFADMFPRRGLWLSKKFGGFDQNPRRRFSSFYGVACGFKAPSDGFSFWNQWLGHHRYSVDAQIDSQTATRIQTFFNTWQTRYPKPFMNKNNRNVDCAIQLAQILPNAHFIEIRRDPVEVAKSLLAAREFVQGDRARPWGLHSHRFVDSGQPIQQVCSQIESFTRQLDANKAAIPSDRYHQVRFEEFRRRPAAVAQNLQDRIPGLQLRQPQAMEQLVPFNTLPGVHPDDPGQDEENRLLRELLQQS